MERKLLSFFLTVLMTFVLPAQAATSSQTFTMDGQLFLTGTSTPLTDATAKIRVYIMNPAGTCLLYVEEQTVDTLISNGYFNIQVGSDTGSIKRVVGLDPGRTMLQVYQNSTAITANSVPGQTCAGGVYTPTNGDGRLVRMIVTPTSGSPDPLTPDLVMDMAPMSKVAETVQGLAPASLLQVNNSGSVALTQTNLESAFTGTAWTNIQAVMAGTFGGVTSVSATAGSAASPSIAFSGDSNTGFFNPVTDTIAVTTGGVERVRVDASGFVGIGTTTPTARLDVKDTLHISGATSGYVGLKAAAAAGNTVYTLPSADGSANQALVTDGSGVLSWATISGSGGGSGFPVAPGAVNTPSMNFSGDTDTGIFSPGAEMLAISTAGTERMRFSGSNVGIGTTNPTTLLTVHEAGSVDNNIYLTNGGGMSLWIGGNQNETWWWNGTATPTTLYTDSVERLRIMPSGEVGIGTTNPQAQLHVRNSTGTGVTAIVEGGGQYSSLRIQSTNRGSGSYLELAGNDEGTTNYDASTIRTVGMGGALTLESSSGLINFKNSRLNISLGSTDASHITMLETGHGSGGQAVSRINYGLLAFSQDINSDTLMIDTASTSHNKPLFRVYEGGIPRVHVKGTGGYVGIGTSNPTELLTVDNGTTVGTYTATGWNHTSDARMKKDIKTIDKALDKVVQLRGVEYKFKKDKQNRTQLGFIAQETEKVFPETVTTDSAGMKSMNYANLVAPVVEAIKDLHAKFTLLFNKSDAQQREIASLKEKAEKLEKENAEIKSYLCKKDPTFCKR